MALSHLQILALKSFSGIGNKSVFKVADNFVDSPSDIEVISLIKKLGLKKKDSDGQKVLITSDDFTHALVKAQKVISDSASLGINVVSYFDKAFPQSLRETKSENGKRVDAPPLLFYKGDLSILKMPSVAIIGTRDCAPGARKAGLFLAKSFAQRGFSIVSGLAIGCDTAAHEGTLAAKNGKTIAFLAHGLDTIYPKQNLALAEDILQQGGLLLSEYEIGTKVSRFSLVARDRLQAGLANATLVIQTGIDGGTMHAACATANANKPLYVVKFSDHETNSLPNTEGNHLLVKDYGAMYLAASPDRVKFEKELDQIGEKIRNHKLLKNANSEPTLL